MTIDEADALKVGDPVICTAEGLSGIHFLEGDVGAVRFKDGVFFAVTLSDGRQTGITAPGHWEHWTYDARSAQTSEEQTAKTHPQRTAQTVSCC